jgi:hypothetical protein
VHSTIELQPQSPELHFRKLALLAALQQRFRGREWRLVRLVSILIKALLLKTSQTYEMGKTWMRRITE